jgi:pilus assembly protein TadC
MHHLQKRELKLSKENRVHFCQGLGFIQVPVADSEELYGIKFKEANLVEGEEFYTKLIKAIGELVSNVLKFVCRYLYMLSLPRLHLKMFLVLILKYPLVTMAIPILLVEIQATN